MPIEINYNICDNSPECSGIAVCEFDAIFWDEEKLNPLGEKGFIQIDNALCTSCGLCVGDDGCPVGAIIFANTQDELTKLAENLEIDINQIEALFVERYGGEPIDENVCVGLDEINDILKKDDIVYFVEEFVDDSIECLLTSIPIESITQKIKTSLNISKIGYFKIDYTDLEANNEIFPRLKIFKGDTLLGQIDKYYDNSHFDELISLMTNYLIEKE